MHTDLLVIGTGIAGLTYAIKLAERSPNIRIILISKGSLMAGNTKYAQGGIAVVSNFNKDNFDKHIQDTYKAGDAMGDLSVIDFVVREGKNRLQELINWGTQFDREENNLLALTKEGGHSEKRIVHFKDHSGAEIHRALIAKIKKIETIKLFENHILVDLITDHHTGTTNNRCYGAYIISTLDEKIFKITASITVLSTGGLGQLYAFTTNPKEATGDGLGAAYRAKVQLKGLPYIQFHPTVLYPKINGETFLITEALRGEGAQLINHKGEAFMYRYHPQAELAPRDVVARSIVREMKLEQEKHVFLDARKINQSVLFKHFPNVMSNCLSIGIDPLTTPIPVIPAAHYSCGGIQVDHHARTSLQGLYAIGECSYTGLHGANRLASNALLESIVFSHRAALKSLKEFHKIKLNASFYHNIPDWKGNNYSNEKPIALIQLLRRHLCEIMTQHLGVFKTTEGLKIAQQSIRKLYFKMNKIYNTNVLSPQLCELRNMVSVAYVLINQSIEIKENKGVFYNQNYERE